MKYLNHEFIQICLENNFIYFDKFYKCLKCNIIIFSTSNDSYFVPNSNIFYYYKPPYVDTKENILKITCEEEIIKNIIE